MIAPYRLLSMRYLRRRWDRAALIVASIALGVATLVSSQTLNRVIEAGAEQTTNPLKDTAAYTISNGNAGVLASVATEVRNAKLAGVDDVVPILVERVTLPQLGNRPAVLLASDEGSVSRFQSAKIVLADESKMWRHFGRDKVLVSKPVYDAIEDDGVQAKVLALKAGNREQNYWIFGYFEAPPDSPLAALGQNIVVMGLNGANRFLQPENPPTVKRIDVYSSRPAEDIRTAIQRIVGERAQVLPAERQGENAREIISGLKTAFTLCSLAALIVGLFLVYNAMAVTVTERRQDIGIMRAVGATRPQIVLLFAALAAILGLIGAALGIPLGQALAAYAMSHFQDVLESVFLNPDVDAGRPTPFIIVLALVAGVLTAVLAALIPAIQAASDPPADVVRRRHGPVGGVWAWLHRGICFAMIAGGIVMILVREQLPHRVGGFGGMMIALTGLLLAAPIFVQLCVWLFNPLLRRVLPIEARLAADNLTRAPGRTGVVIGALGAGVAVMLQTAGVGLSNEVPVTDWLDRMLRADYYVVSGNFAASMSSQAPMEPGIVVELNALPGVARATGLRFARPDFNGTVVYLLAVDTGPFSEMLARRRDLPNLEKYRHAVGNRILISENFALRHKVKAGDTIQLPGAKGLVSLEVIATVVDYSWTRGTVIMDRTAYADLFGDRNIDLAHVFLENESGKKTLSDFVDRNGLAALERDTMRKTIGGIMANFYKLAYLQQFIIGVVAALGVLTALLISVLQRTRELGLLRAVGATPAQVLRSVLWEAFFMGLLGTLLGIAIGLPLEWYVVKVIFVDESGFNLDVLIPWRQVFLIAAGSLALALLAGLLPAWRALRIGITDAIAYE